MRISRTARILLGLMLTGVLVGGSVLALHSVQRADQTRIVAYFENTNGVYVGDDVMILGVPVGKIEKIEPLPMDARVTFSVDSQYKVPTNVNAVIISPTLVTARAIQLTPAYTTGPTIGSGDVIPKERTAVPVEYDDLRAQLQKLTDALQPTEPGGVSTLGSFINTAADNVRGQGAQIREALIQMSQTFSALGDHSGDLFGTIKSLSTLVKGLQSSTDLMRQLNVNLDTVTGLLANDPSEVDRAIGDLNAVVADATTFVSQHREALGTTSDKIASISQALNNSLDDLKQTLHITPTAFSNFINIYEPASASITGALAFANFANPISFICGAIQAASRLNNEQSAKLCVQYLAPIVKNRQWNFPPIGGNPIVGAEARPNEVTFSEDWLRPLTEAGRVRDFYEGVYPAPGPGEPAAAPTAGAPLPAEAAPAPAVTDPAAGLPGLMVPQGGGS
ncbi:MCE family protein [Mycobacterium sp. M26]|uniref:MCE family protein n=1 Tax=Mycobacterium sp. M26 TaxID=1762962 RepID=UPI00073FA6AB|nr:MCE family protein [Mycobacterium sp. M26]